MPLCLGLVTPSGQVFVCLLFGLFYNGAVRAATCSHVPNVMLVAVAKIRCYNGAVLEWINFEARTGVRLFHCMMFEVVVVCMMVGP